MHIQSTTQNIAEANKHFAAENFEEALKHYKAAAEEYPGLTKFITLNIYFTLQKLGHKVDIHALIEKPETNDFSEWTAKHVSRHLESRAQILPPEHRKDHAFLTYEEAFDPEFYLEANLDIKAISISPIEHYKNWGWKEGRMPNCWFDPAYYLETYDDAKTSKEEPLSHYIKIGQYENRKTRIFLPERISDSLKKLIPTVAESGKYTEFTEYKHHDLITAKKVKHIAFFLPQFHPFPENDNWWGKGFTEWTNVTKATPNFKDHYQPHLPIHNGFYDLRVPEVLREQAHLARNYGIDGFNFYYYWFGGKVLMHRPFQILTENPDIPIQFCLTWANENWTRRWDGNDDDILIGQTHSNEDSSEFLIHLMKYFDDERYIKIDGKPVLIIYRPNIIPKMRETLELWRNLMIKHGYPGIYLIGAQTFGYNDPREDGFDSLMEFPPHTVKARDVNTELEGLDEHYSGKIYDYQDVVRNACEQTDPESYKKLLTAMLSWDNTARKQTSSHIFARFSIDAYKKWLANISFRTLNNPTLNENEKIIFINAWNEWAEGTHLEPDRRYGYGYLQATHDVAKLFDADLLLQNYIGQKKASDIAIVVHIHYPDTWHELKNALLMTGRDVSFDLYVTLTDMSVHLSSQIRTCFQNVIVLPVENRGRDILPFLQIFKKIYSLGYRYICKLHGKKSTYRADGDQIRHKLISDLLGRSAEIIDMLDQQSGGIYCPREFLIKHSDKNMTYDEPIIISLAEFLNIKFKRGVFPAGSMYWLAPLAARQLLSLPEYIFEVEEGLADGTVAHSLERLMASLVIENGFSVCS